MSDLVPIPWQPHLYLTPHTLALLKAAGKRLGRDLYLYDAMYTTISPAWRSYAQQEAARKRYLAGNGPVASDPDDGPRVHMRGAAFDLRETTAAVRAACKAVGLLPDPDEAWHWNDPNWRDMPVIKTNTSTAGGGSTPFGDDMANPFLFHRRGDGAWRARVDGIWKGLTESPANRLRKVYGDPETLTDAESDQLMRDYPNVDGSELSQEEIDAIATALDAKIDDEAILAAVKAIQTGTADLTPILAALAAADQQADAYQAQLLAAISQVDENTLATFGLKRA